MSRIRLLTIECLQALSDLQKAGEVRHLHHDFYVRWHGKTIAER
jgi:hypothetical protein